LKKILSKILLSGIILFIAAIAWLMGSNSGLTWILQQVQNNSDIEIQYSQVEGSLWSEIRFAHLIVKWPLNTLTVDALEFKANLFPLMIGKIDINKLIGEKILLVTEPSEIVNQETPVPTDQISFNISNYRLPIRLVVNEMSIHQFDYQQATTRENLFQQLNLTNASLGPSIKFEEFVMRRQNLALVGKGEVPFNESEDIDLKINLNYDINETLKNVPIEINISGVFPRIDILAASAGQIILNTDSQIDLNDLNSITWKSEIATSNLDLNKLVTGLDTHVKNAKIAVKGLVKNQQLSTVKLNSTFNVSNLTTTLNSEYNVLLKAGLDDHQWRIETLTLEQPEKKQKVEISGMIGTDFNFSGQTKTNFQVRASNFRWPESDPILSCNSGILSVEGSINNYQFSYNGDLTAAQNVITKMDFSGQGNLQKLAINKFDAEYLSGAWKGNGEFSWEKELLWKAKLLAKNADISMLPYPSTANFHSNLTGTLEHDGGFKNDELFIHVATGGLDGIINDNKLTSAVDFLFRNDSLFFRNIKVNNRGSKLIGDLTFTALSGDTTIESNWSLNTKDISGLYPGIHGQVISKGEIQGKLTSPIASLSIQAKNIGNSDFNIASLNSTLRHSQDQKELSQLNISMKNVDFQGKNTLSSISIKGDGDLQHHQLLTNLAIDKDNQASFSLDGALKDKVWYAIITQTQIEKDGRPGWLQPDGANLTISAEKSSLVHFCLTKINAVDRICIENGKYSPRKSQLKAKVSNIDLGKLLPRINSKIHNIDGKLTVDIDLAYDDKFNPSLSTNLYVLNGEIDLASYNPKLPKLKFDRVIAKGKTNSGAFIGNAHAEIPGQGELKADWNFADLRSLLSGDLNSPVVANLDISLNQLALIPEFIPDAQATTGSWENQLQVSGPLQKPKITGISKLNIDSLSIPRLGIKPNPTTVSVTTDNSGKISFEGSTKSGDGKIIVTGTVPSYQEILEGLDLSSKGEKFQLFDLPEAKVVISPDLKLTSSKGILDLQGKVKVPFARIKVYDAGNGVSLSGDVKIVGQEPDEEAAPIRLTADITINLGDDIVIDTAGLKGKLSGSVTISERIGKATTAVGELDIKDGIYNAYGRELKIEEGKIIYTSSPIENPSLQIKAVSKNSNDVIAGVKITGSARNPVVTLFSEPPMDQSDILAYIVLGYPINQASNEEGELLAKAATSIGFLGGEKMIRNLTEQFGLDEVKIRSSNTTKEASLVLGKYLSPKLYVQYAVGIGDTVNSMMLDYKWTKRISIKSESGQSQSTDIIYSFEKD